MTDNQNVTNESILHSMEERLTRRLYNDQYNDKYHNEVVALEEFLCQSTGDTDSADAPGDSRGVGGAVPDAASVVTDNENFAHSNTDGKRKIASYMPEVSNTGISTYHHAEFPPFPRTEPLKSGHYDGGTENAFFSPCSPQWWKNINIIGEAKVRAQQQKRGMKEFIFLGGEKVLVHPRGKPVGNNKYEYMIEWGGYDLKIWDNPEKPPALGHVRVRYGAEVLAEYGWDESQQRLLDWLASLGFVPYSEFGEKLTRVDLNVCVPIAVSEFESLIQNGHAVSRVRKNVTWKDCLKAETYEIGKPSSVQMRIYDKGVELGNELDKNPRKHLLTIQRYIGADWINSGRPITRIEFSIGRVMMNCWGENNKPIHTLAEFRARERAIVELLTRRWFRILEHPKVRGHENTAKLHPHWETVDAEFQRCYDGSTAKLERVKKNVSVDLKRLKQMLRGIARKVGAHQHGAVKSLLEMRMVVSGIVRGLLTKEDLDVWNNIVAVYETQKCCKLGVDEGLDEFKLFESG